MTHTLSRTTLDQGSARHICLSPHNQQHSQEMDIHVASGIRTRNPSKRAAADLRLWDTGHRHRPHPILTSATSHPYIGHIQSLHRPHPILTTATSNPYDGHIPSLRRTSNQSATLLLLAIFFFVSKET